jgi:beta-glucuronidase
MLYPQRNLSRSLMNLSGIWQFQADVDDNGIERHWFDGLPEPDYIAVPASWNDQIPVLRDFLGPLWYQSQIEIPPAWQSQRIWLRFASVNYHATVYLNGQPLGQHEGGHLPFEFDVTQAVQPGDNLLVVRVDGRLSPSTLPPGYLPDDPRDGFPYQSTSFPPAGFDFFPYAGIHRPVVLYTTAPRHIKDLTVTMQSNPKTATVLVQVEHDQVHNLRVCLDGHTPWQDVDSDKIEIEVSTPRLWQPDDPYLYDLKVEMFDGSNVIDRYTLPVGIRTVEVDNDQLLLNRRPIQLLGFGRHEDFPVVGRGELQPLIIKDHQLLKWIGANSFRTSHYPYSEEVMRLADRTGMLIIDETPIVGMYFREEGMDIRRSLSHQYVRELIRRDKNHPSVIMWSLANEPHSNREGHAQYFEDLVAYARSLDDSRPITVTSYIGEKEAAFEHCDVVCMNRYMGWYTESGQVDLGVEHLETELDAIYEKYPKPMIITEFGVDTIPGAHSYPPEMFTEEYQVEFLTAYTELFNRKPYIIGQHVWNLCDFKTTQGTIRVNGLNHKGVFTRDRRPKAAAHTLKKLWELMQSQDNEEES